GSELRAEGTGDLGVGSPRGVVIDAGKAVDLEIDEAGSEVEIRGLGGWGDGVDGTLKGQLDGVAGDRAGAGTSEGFHDLYTSLAHRKRRKYMAWRGWIVVQNAGIPLAPGTRAALQ